MAEPSEDPAPDAVAAVAQSREGSETEAGSDVPRRQPGEGILYEIGERVTRPGAEPYERQPEDPVYRSLRILSLDPAVSRLEGGLVEAKVPFEPLEKGFSGRLLEVSSESLDGTHWALAEPDAPRVLMHAGYDPALSDPCFHQQMVYAVAMTTCANFRLALGRHVDWAFRPQKGRTRLLLRPHGVKEANAWYDRERGEIVFGHYEAKIATSTARPGSGAIFTSVSHDIIAHETTHALLDGLRSHFLIATHPDVPAFHEAFADLVAFFQHFTFEAYVRSALARARGSLVDASAVLQIARNFASGLPGTDGALRTLSDLEGLMPGDPTADAAEKRQVLRYEHAGDEPHDRGRVLARAVVAAFLALYERRTRRLVRLATGGTGTLPPGDAPDLLIDLLVGEVRRLASQMLQLCIRAIDYCPPVDIRFGDYLRALITADRDLVADDDWGYREALIHAFGERGIYGEGTDFMSEEALSWRPPEVDLDPIEDLSFGRMAFLGDPSRSCGPEELSRQAGALGRLATRPEVARDFGLVPPGAPSYAEGGYQRPVIESIRSARRVGPDQQIAFDSVAEIVQARSATDAEGRRFDFVGGATVILGPSGNVRYVIRKRVTNEERLKEQVEQMSGALSRFWAADDERLSPATDSSRNLCAVR